MYHYNFLTIHTESLIHTKSLDYYLLLREYCFYQKLYLKVKFFLYDLLLIWKQFLCQEIKQSLMKFSIYFCLISWHKDHFRNINKKIKRKINLHTKGTLKGTNKRYLYSFKTLTKSQIWKKLNFLSDILDLSHIHQLSVTDFGHFETYFWSVFHVH